MINSYNEWDPLKKVIVGSASHANWPVYDATFRAEEDKTLWKESPLPKGPVPQWIIDEANEDLQILSDTLTNLGVEVIRPADWNFQMHDGMYNYCPRDRLLVHGRNILDVPMMYHCRDMEMVCYEEVFNMCDNGTDTCGLFDYMPRGEGAEERIMDAANVLRLGKDKMLFLESSSGNKAAYEWLVNRFPEVHIELCNFYAGVHIDSTIVPLREGLVLLNGSRVNEGNCPKVFSDWEKIYVDDVEPQNFYQYPYASKWIALNMLVVDPQTVICDKQQVGLIQILESKDFKVIPLELRHSRTLGGGFHCVTLDLLREHNK